MKTACVAFIAVASALLVGAACQSKRAVSTSQSPSEPDTVVVVMEQAAEPHDSLVLSLEKTPCFGMCPVYELKVYESGYATYFGKNFTEKIGRYATTLTPEALDKIYHMALSSNYFATDTLYNNPQVTDLPSTISMIAMQGRRHRVTARMGVPESLASFHKNLEVFLLEQDWKARELR